MNTDVDAPARCPRIRVEFDDETALGKACRGHVLGGAGTRRAEEEPSGTGGGELEVRMLGRRTENVAMSGMVEGEEMNDPPLATTVHAGTTLVGAILANAPDEAVGTDLRLLQREPHRLYVFAQRILQPADHHSAPLRHLFQYRPADVLRIPVPWRGPAHDDGLPLCREGIAHVTQDLFLRGQQIRPVVSDDAKSPVDVSVGIERRHRQHRAVDIEALHQLEAVVLGAVGGQEHDLHRTAGQPLSPAATGQPDDSRFSGRRRDG